MSDWLERELETGEKVVWRGQPIDKLFVFQPIDLFIIPFSLIWFFAMSGAFTVFWTHPGELAPSMDSLTRLAFLILMPLFMLLVGVYVVIGRFFVGRLYRRRVEYALTSRRLFLKSGFWTKTTRRRWLTALPELTVKERHDGTGTISFGDGVAGFAYMTGVSTFMPGLFPGLIFEQIEDVENVSKLIEDARRETLAR